MKYKLLHGNCLNKMKEMDDNSVDSIVTDPPYGLSFMGKKWDYDVPSVEIWRECFRVLKPGGHLLAFAGSRTYHRMAVNVEDAGFEIRDQIMWIYGSGFPKSFNISKGIDKAFGLEREVIGQRNPFIDGGKRRTSSKSSGVDFVTEEHLTDGLMDVTAPASPEAEQWEGWGSALKPAHEPIVVARKPLIGTIVENVLEHGTGGLNIDGCRIEHNDPMITRKDFESNTGDIFWGAGRSSSDAGPSAAGRFPANVIHDGSDEVVNLFPQSSTTGNRTERSASRQKKGGDSHIGWHSDRSKSEYSDSGSASRFFYCAKASKAERNAGLEALESKKSHHNSGGIGRKVSVEKRLEQGKENAPMMKNIHPTVKPVNLMKYLCRLVTPQNGIVLDPFMGSGTTGIAATTEGFNFIGVEMDDEYIKIANHRISHWVEEKQELIIEERKQKTLFREW